MIGKTGKNISEETKLAVALQYPEGVSAPFISASGKADLAEKIIGIARANGVPIREDRNLAEVLSTVRVGELIPLETYEAVAAVFVFLKTFGRKYYE